MIEAENAVAMKFVMRDVTLKASRRCRASRAS